MNQWLQSCEKLPEISQLYLHLSLCLKQLELCSGFSNSVFVGFFSTLKLAGCWFNNTKLLNSLLWIQNVNQICRGIEVCYKSDRKFQNESCCSLEAEQLQTTHPFKENFPGCPCLLLGVEIEQCVNMQLWVVGQRYKSWWETRWNFIQEQLEGFMLALEGWTIATRKKINGIRSCAQSEQCTHN